MHVAVFVVVLLLLVYLVFYLMLMMLMSSCDGALTQSGDRGSGSTIAWQRRGCVTRLRESRYWTLGHILREATQRIRGARPANPRR